MPGAKNSTTKDAKIWINQETRKARNRTRRALISVFFVCSVVESGGFC